MTHRYCHRCHADLPRYDEGTLIFCTQCGAPQVTLSEELKSQMESHLESQMESQTQSQMGEQAPGPNSGPNPGPNPGIDSGSKPATTSSRPQVWAVALRCVALAAAIAAGLEFAALAFPLVILLVWLWAVVSPVVVIGLFQARSPLTPVTTGFGARLGLVTGLAVAAALSIVNVASLVIARHMRWMGDFDARFNTAIDQMKMQVAAQPGGAAIPFANALSLPEFRAGVLLAGGAMLIAMLLVLTTAGGAFAGFIRSQKRA